MRSSYILNMGVEVTPLYTAVAAVKDRWLDEGGLEPLYCQSCGRSPGEDANAWRYRSDGVGELHPFCPECDRREFGVT